MNNATTRVWGEGSTHRMMQTIIAAIFVGQSTKSLLYVTDNVVALFIQHMTDRR